jgi:hypothetical protein
MRISLLALILCLGATPASAGELFAGVYAHAVSTPLSLDGDRESGIDLQLGLRGPGIRGTGLAPYVFGALHSQGVTSYAAAGVAWKFGDRIFVRPGLGLAIHSGSAADFQRRDRIAFGSRVLLEPELGIGARLSRRATIEASWVHLSHGQLFGGQNPGIDNLGARLSLAL